MSELGFAAALRLVRKAKGLSQEDFGDVSSRVYISELERGIKFPTLPKVDELARVLGVHPLVILVLAYSRQGEDPESLLGEVEVGLESLLLRLESAGMPSDRGPGQA